MSSCPWLHYPEKDRADLEFACELGIDWLALSFVQRPEDLVEARELAKGRAAILSKIEKPSAVERFDDILNASDGIMVARGDLGVELPVQNVPPIQKRLVRKCRAAGKTRDRGDADVGKHDRKPHAHTGRGFGCGNRDL
jgi:pyruvate kinase